MGVSGSQDHVIKARNWLWNSVLPLLCSQVSCSWPDTIAFLCNIYAKILWTRWKWLLQETRAKMQSCDGKCQKIPSTGAWGRYMIPIVFTKMYTLQSAVHGLHHFEWLTDWLANESLNQVSDWHLSVYCKIYAQGRYPWNSSYQWRFYIHLTIFVFLWLHEGHSYHGSADDQVEVKVHVTTHTICSAGRVTQWQHVWEPGIHLHGNQFRSPE